MKTMRVLGLAALILTSGGPAAGAPVVPEPLKPWVPWVLRDATDAASPPDFRDASKRLATWPSALQLAVDPAGGTFSLKVAAFDAAWLHLPGSAETWPRDVTVDGSPAPVVARDERPAIRLEPGTRTIAGSFRWSAIPEKLAVPPGIGIVNLTAEGRPVEAPQWESDGTLWLKRSRAEAADRDVISLKVYRLLEDGIPLRLHTEIELSVSGKSREEELGHALPDGWRPAAVASALPCALDDDGRLRVQVRAGKWSVAIDAFRTDPPDTLRMAEGRRALAEQELLAFQAAPALRTVELRGLTSIDVSQTTLPERWRRLPVWLWETKSAFTIEEKLRGMGTQRPPGLAFTREFWLDEDGGGLTWRDHLSGTGQRTWRLDAAPGQKLGAVKIGGEGQLITRHPETGAEGVEVRQRDLLLTATGRAAFSGTLPATGWQADAEQLGASLHLPAGWRLLAVFGPEWSRGDWLTSWSLLDVFMVLILTLALQRLHGWPAAAVGMAALVLAWQEPTAPRWSWGVLVLIGALQRVVPGAKAARILRIAGLAAALAFAVVAVPFISRQLTGMLHPQVETVQAPSFLPGGGGGVENAAKIAPREPAAAAEETSMADPFASASDAGDGRQQRAARQAANLGYDSKAKIQTGPAIPEVNWRTVSFGWRGPVSQKQEVRLVLLPVLPQRILTGARVLLVLVLAWILLRSRRPAAGTPPPAPSLPPLPPAAGPAAALVAALLALAAAPAARCQENGNPVAPPFPPDKLLEALRAELQRAPDAFPGAAEIPHVSLRLADRTLTMEVEVHAAAFCAVPLPGQLPAWSPLAVTVDNAPAAALTRRDGCLWTALQPGVHRITVTGQIPPASEWQWSFLLRPRSVSIDAPGWNVTGVKPDGVPEAQVFFTRQQAAAAAEAAYDRRDFQSVAAVERRIELGLVWQVRTRVVRLTATGKALSLSLPLLPGERPLTAGLTPTDGRVDVRLGAADDEFVWESELPVQTALTLTAEKSGSWVERWWLQSSPVWNVTLTGLAPVFSQEAHDLVPSWAPWPGESVTLAVARPEAITGETTTVRAVRHDTEVGTQRRTAVLRLDLEASTGGDFPVVLEPGAEVASLSIGGQAVPVRQDGASVIVPVRPGVQSVELKWHVMSPLGTSVRAGGVTLPVESANVRQRLLLPENRWILWARGPRMGPAVRFWAVLAGAVVFGFVLGGLRHSPFRRWQWVLLLMGLTQVPLLAGGCLVAWFFWLAWRGSPDGPRPAGTWFNAGQVLLALGVLPVLGVVAMVLYTGLLGQPTMFLLGEGSWRTTMQWFTARGARDLPQPEAISVSIWVYRAIMLAWSLWLALTLLTMARWAWAQFSAGGLWTSRPAPVPRQPTNPPAIPPGGATPS